MEYSFGISFGILNKVNHTTLVTPPCYLNSNLHNVKTWS